MSMDEIKLYRQDKLLEFIMIEILLNIVKYHFK